MKKALLFIALSFAASIAYADMVLMNIDKTFQVPYMIFYCGKEQKDSVDLRNMLSSRNLEFQTAYESADQQTIEIIVDANKALFEGYYKGDVIFIHWSTWVSSAKKLVDYYVAVEFTNGYQFYYWIYVQK